MSSKLNMRNRIMIVDDDHDLLFVLQAQLKKEGFKVYTNVGGEDLLEEMSERKIDIVLLDLSMNMINGGELCKKLKKTPALSNTKVLIMSGNHNIETVASDCGADGFVAKPISLGEVKSALAKYS